MAVLKCKMCGGNLNVDGDENIVECEFCGSTQTIPDVKEEKKVNLYNRANKLRISCEFDKAAMLYEQILAEYPEDAEAYFCLCLCNYGIEYVDDPVTGEKIPTCHRANYEKMRKNEYYELALENADITSRNIYENQAKEIDRIIGEIIAISKDERPYDIFICYKETDNIKERTPDSVLAQNIFDSLTEHGYRVFFSRITLEDKLGAQYEPYIFSALNSAKVMLVVGTDYGYFNAVWVKNEWSRFLQLTKDDKSKVLIPCYKDMDPYDMPDEFKILQSLDCGKIGFMQDLLRGIDKIFGKLDSRVEGYRSLSEGEAVKTATLLERAFMFLEDGNWKEADSYCEKVLDIDPHNSMAYVGKLMSELSVNNEEDLAQCSRPFDNKDSYKRAIQYSDEVKTRLNTYISMINKRNETVKNDVEDVYSQLIDICKNGNKVISFEKQFLLKKEEKENYENQLEEIKKRINTLGISEGDYTLLKGKVDKYNEELGSKNKDKQDLIRWIDYFNRSLNDASALALFRKKSIQSDLEFYKSELLKLEKDINTLEIEMQPFIDKLETIELAEQVKNHISDCNKELDDLEVKNIEEKKSGRSKLSINDLYNKIISEPEIERIISSDREKWTYLTHSGLSIPKLCIALDLPVLWFGHYPSESSKPIEWMPLSIEDNKVLVISHYSLVFKPYNDTNENVTWENCSLRRWLNDSFVNEAFSEDEQAQILFTHVSADKNPVYGDRADPGNMTVDQMFLLSAQEVQKHFNENHLTCPATQYSQDMARKFDDNFCNDGWWLRSPGQSLTDALYVKDSIHFLGMYVAARRMAVRPAMWINLDV